MRAAARCFRFCAAAVLLAVGCAGTFRAARASVAQWLYHRAKFGVWADLSDKTPPIEDGAAAAAVCRKAARLYPWNWYFPSWAAKVLYLEATDPATSDERWPVALRESADFAARALALNPYDAEIRWIYAENLVAAERVPDAIAWWRGVVDREFWNPANQNELASLLLREGSEESKAEALSLIPLTNRDMRKRLELMKREIAKAERDRKRAEAEARKKAEAERRKAEAEARKKAEAERRKAEAEARKQADAAKKAG